MTQQKAGYPLDYSKGSADAGKDRLRETTDVPHLNRWRCAVRVHPIDRSMNGRHRHQPKGRPTTICAESELSLIHI